MPTSVKMLVSFMLLFGLFYMAKATRTLPIEADLNTRAQAALASAEIDWAKVRVNGRRAVLTGLAPSPDAAQRALKTVARVRGIHSALDNLKTLQIVSPFEWQAVSLGRTLKLMGVVPSGDAYDAVTQAAAAIFPNHTVETKLELAAGVPGGNWLGAVRYGLQQLARLDEGTLRLRDTQVDLSGKTASSQIIKKVELAMRGLPAGYTGRDRVTLKLRNIDTQPILLRDLSQNTLIPIFVPTEAQQQIDLCQQRINSVMRSEKIRFKSASAEVLQQARPIIKSLADIAKECPTSRIVISGHTDASGDADENLALSKARAQAIVDLLIAQDIPENRLSAEGYGASRPIADNDTQAGRQANRRIEFRVLYSG
ncbi:MAG: OmpA family protein [Pseudomonadota bacterium]